MEETSIKGVLGGYQTCSKERIEVLSDAIAIILHETLPTCGIPKVVRMETVEIIYEKVYASHRPPPMISMKHDWMKELGSEVARQAEGQTQIQIMIEMGDPLLLKTRPVRVIRKSMHVSLATARTPMNGETRCERTTSRFVLNVQ